MGKFRSKLKGQTKGKRWAKGQSSSSNPETKKYRNAAKSRFFQENLGPSNLTTDALRKHDVKNAFLTSSAPTEMEEDGISEASSYRTIQTFASDWSECSNASFSKLMNVFRPDSALHKEMLAILAAVTEVIKQNGGQESSTEYYAALMTTLEACETEESLCASLSLLNMGIKSVPHSVLRLQFSQASKMFLDLLNKNINSDNNTVLKSLLGIISCLLRVQESAVWNNASTMQMFNLLLAFSLHSKPKIRKAAQHGICSILKGSPFMIDNPESAPSHHPAATQLAQYCIQQIEGSIGLAKQTTILHTLALLKDVIHTFPKQQIKSTSEVILKIMTVNNPLVSSCGMQVLHSLFSAQTVTVPASLNGQLISALYDYQPATTDTQPMSAWILVMQQAHVHLADVDISTSALTLPKITHTLTQLWLSERPEVMNATTRALQIIFEDCVGPICATTDTVQQHNTVLVKCFDNVSSCLGYQYNKAWHQVLHVIATMFKVAGKNCSEHLLKCLKTLAELRDSYKFSYNNELEFAVGAAIKSMGPSIVLTHISLKKNDDEINIDRTWLLPVLKENIQFSTLEYFLKDILPLAILCQNKANYLSANHDGVGAHSYELLFLQLWNLLPSFCNNPTDVKENFKSIARILGTVLSDKKDLRLSVMASLRKLIHTAKGNEDEGEIKELGRFAKNYLPILFNLYTTKANGTDDEGRRLAALDTIKVYLSIAPPELQQQLFTNALERLQTSSPSNEDQFIKESILDLIRVLSRFQPKSAIQILYDQCIQNLIDLKNNKEQKKAYRLLEEIFSSESEGCKDFLNENKKAVQKLLVKSLNTAAVTSKGARLRCFNYMVKSQPQLGHDSKLFRAIIPEAVLCCKDINEKCRAAAYDLLNSIGEVLASHNQMKEYITLLVAGLTGTTEMVSCTVLALASVIHNFSGSLGMENLTLILETISHLTQSTTREIVLSCLSFIKVYLTSLPSPLVASSIPVLVKSLTQMTDDCKRHFRLKVRDILDRLVRKYGCDSVSQHVSASDTVMHKRLRNLRKLNERKKRMKEEKKKQEDEDMEDDFIVRSKPTSVEDILADSDSDLETMDIDQPAKPRVNTYIQEDADSIVDFTDPSAVSKITASRPGTSGPVNPGSVAPSKKDRGFKTAADGRLIIMDDNSDEEGTGKKKKGFLSLNSDSDDSDNDDKSAAETAILKDRKRKRSDMESMKSGITAKSGVSAASGFSQPSMKYKAGGSGIHRPLKSNASVYNDTGSEYRSKKAKGDVKKKGKLDPYAYLPLSRSSLNKRKKMKNSGQFKSIVRAAKKGAQKGMKAKKSKKN